MNSWRYEIKFAAHRHRKEDLISMLNLLPIQLKFHYETRKVNNIYFDNDLSQCLNDNMSGRSKRYKVRLRWYGETLAMKTSHLEIKIKDNHVNRKRFVKIDESFTFENENWTNIVNKIKAHVGSDSEVERLFMETNRPVLINSYYRNYFISQCGKVRMTLDYDQRGINQIYSVRPKVNTRIYQHSPCIIEIKGFEEDYNTIIEAANQLPFKRTKWSKYVYWMHHA
jgi:hypothetical protein